jgi:hypothetical protein
MSFTTILLAIAAVGYIVYRRVEGRPVGGPRELFVLPVILVVLGGNDLTSSHPDALAVAAAVAGGAVSVALGALRGAVDRLSVRDGVPWVRWGGASILVLAANVAVKVIIDIAAVAMGAGSVIDQSLVLAAGLALLGEAAVIWLRAGRPVPQRSDPARG